MPPKRPRIPVSRTKRRPEADRPQFPDEALAAGENTADILGPAMSGTAFPDEIPDMVGGGGPPEGGPPEGGTEGLPPPTDQDLFANFQSGWESAIQLIGGILDEEKLRIQNDEDYGSEMADVLSAQIDYLMTRIEADTSVEGPGSLPMIEEGGEAPVLPAGEEETPIAPEGLI